MSKGSSKLIVVGKLILGLLLLTVLISRADITAVLRSFASIDLRFAALVFVFPHIGILVSTMKWDILLRKVSMTINFRRLLGLYFIGTFFSVFLPTMIGGDIYRVYQLSRESQNAPAAIAATFMERFIGLAALVSLLPLCLLQSPVTEQWPLLGIVVGAMIAVYALTVFFIFSCVEVPGAQLIRSISWINKLVSSMDGSVKKIRAFPLSRQVLFFSFILSIIFYLVAAASSWAANISIGADVSYIYLLSVVPMILLGGLLPISLNGLGITELGYVIFLELIGVQAADALAAAFLLRIRLLFTALIGGGLFVISKSAQTPAQTGMECPEDV